MLWDAALREFRAEKDGSAHLRMGRLAAKLLPHSSPADLQWLARALVDEELKTFAWCLFQGASAAPPELFDPLMRAAVRGAGSPTGQWDRMWVEVGIRFYGLPRVHASLLNVVRTGPGADVAPALQALRWAPPTPDLQREQDRVFLRTFVETSNETARQWIVGRLSLEPSNYPETERPLVERALAIARTHPDAWVREQVDDQLKFARLLKNPGIWGETVRQFLDGGGDWRACKRAASLLDRVSAEDVRWLADALGVGAARLKYYAASLLGQIPKWCSMPPELLPALVRAAVVERDPSAHRVFVEAAVRGFGPGRVVDALLDCMERGSEAEIIGAEGALYWARGAPGTGEDPNRRCAVFLKCFIENPSIPVRRSLVGPVMSDPSGCPEELRPLLERAREIALGHPDAWIREHALVSLIQVRPNPWSLGSAPSLTIENLPQNGTLSIRESTSFGPPNSTGATPVLPPRQRGDYLKVTLSDVGGGRIVWDGASEAGVRAAPGKYTVGVKTEKALRMIELKIDP